MNRLLFFLVLSLLLTSCFKTAEQIRREQMVDKMSKEVSQSQNLLSELTLKTKQLEDLLSKYQGKIEEIKYQQDQSISDQENLDALSIPDKINNNISRINSLEEQMVEIKDYLAKITKSLKYIKPSTKKMKSTTKTNNSEEGLFNQSLSYFKQKNYSKAKSLCENLIIRKSISAGKINRCRFNLGIIAFKNNKYENALIHFSKIYEKWPKSSMSPESLFYIGKILHKMDKKTKSIEALNQFLSQYPQDKLKANVESYLDNIQ
jgi:TolA-binding protein